MYVKRLPDVKTPFKTLSAKANVLHGFGILLTAILLTIESSAAAVSGISVTAFGRQRGTAPSGWGVLVRSNIENDAVVGTATIVMSDACQPRISSDGKKVAFIMRDRAVSDSHAVIAVANIDGSGLTRLAPSRYKSNSPTYIPIGQLAWTTDNQGLIYTCGTSNKLLEISIATGAVDTLAAFFEQGSTGYSPYAPGQFIHFTDNGRKIFLHNGGCINLPLPTATMVLCSLSNTSRGTYSSKPFGRGCQTAIAPSGSYALWAPGIDVHSTLRIYPWWTEDTGGYAHRFVWDTLKTWGPDTSGKMTYANFRDIHQWSANDDHWICAAEDYDQVLYNWVEHRRIRVTRNAYNPSGVYYDAGPGSFWVAPPADTTPIIKLDTAALYFRADSGGSNPSAQLVHITNSGNGTLPQVTFSIAPASAWLSVLRNGSGNTQNLSNGISIAGLRSGTYRATVMVTGVGVLLPRSYDVHLTVNAPIIYSRVEVTPATATILSGDTIRFRATALDQFGAALAIQPASWSWSANGGGTIASGLFAAAPMGEGTFTVTATGMVGGVSRSGSSTVVISRPPITVTAPNGREVFHPGEKLHVRWTADTAFVRQVSVKISTDDGLSWQDISSRSISLGDSTWGDFSWTVTRTIFGPGDTAAVQNRMRVKVERYADTRVYDMSDSTFTIIVSTPVAVSSSTARVVNASVNGGSLNVHVPFQGRHRLEVLTLDGRRILMRSAVGEATYCLKAPHARMDAVILRIQTEGQTYTRMLIRP